MMNNSLSPAFLVYAAAVAAGVGCRPCYTGPMALSLAPDESHLVVAEIEAEVQVVLVVSVSGFDGRKDAAVSESGEFTLTGADSNWSFAGLSNNLPLGEDPLHCAFDAELAFKLEVGDGTTDLPSDLQAPIVVSLFAPSDSKTIQLWRDWSVIAEWETWIS